MGVVANQLPSTDRLREVLSYDPDTGIFRWRETKGRKKADRVAGDRTSNGYWRIRVDMMRYMAHRLAWKYFYGTEPAEFIDHINGNPLDNRIANLREADTSQNLFNRRRNSSSKSSFKGVTKIKQRSRDAFSVQICARGIKYWVGNFSTEEDAAAAYRSKALEIHGEFANVG